MTYDFDLLTTTPKDVQTKYAGLLDHFGMTDQATQSIALFRDPETAQALAGACDAVRACFEASGFAFTSYNDGASDNEYAADDKEARARILSRLQENVEALPGDVMWNGFDIGDFFVAAFGAMPAPRKRKTFADVRRRVRAPMVLTQSKRIFPRAISRPLSTPAPGL
ncbi:MAG: hypothetical protein ACU0GG_18795 [Paracoccaceae bacterium]